MIATTDKETADQAIPGFYIEDIAAASQQETAALAEPNPQEDSALTDTNKTAELAEQAKVLTERESALKARETELAEAETAARRGHIRAQISAHEQAGRTLPVDSAALVALAETLAVQAVEIELADTEGKTSKGALGVWFEEWLLRLPVQVDYAEHSAEQGAPKPASLKVPPGYSVTAKGADLHAKVLALAEQKDISYELALDRINQQQGEGAA